MLRLSQSKRLARRGTIYLVVLASATIVALLGLAAVTIAQSQLRRVAEAEDWNDAGDLALAAIELAAARIGNDSNWRTTYTNNVEISQISVGQGKLSFKLVDASPDVVGGDGSLSNDATDPARLIGIGRVNSVTRAYSVLLVGDTPLSCLRDALVVGRNLDVNIPTTTTAPISVGNRITVNQQLVGCIDAANITNNSVIIGTTGSSPDSLPPRAVFDLYKAIATTISWPSGGNLTGTQLTAGVNPFGTVNSLGVYYISVPASQTLQVQVSRIQGTLVIECANQGVVSVAGLTSWEPPAEDMPTLLIRNNGNGAVSHILQPRSGSVVVSSVTYPSEIDGLIHVLGNTSAPASSQIVRVGGGGGPVNGPVLVDGDAAFQSGSTAQIGWRPTIAANPPIGYTTGASVKIKPGSGLWEPAP